MNAARPEILLKTQQVARALGVSASTIKRWVDGGALPAARTVGKHRLIGLSEALRFARLQGLPQAGLEAFAGRGTLPVVTIDERLIESAAEAMRRGDVRRIRSLISSAYATGCGAPVLADQLIRPVMERLGHQWEAGAIDVFQEHQATQAVTTALIALNDRASRSVPTPAPLALGGTPEGDPYLLPLLLGELALREQGWDVRNLGINLPLRSLAQAIAEYRPVLVFLSVSHLDEAGRERFLREYPGVSKAAVLARAAIVLGGRALDPGLRGRLSYSGFGDRMAHLSEFARRLPGAPRPAAESPGPDDSLDPA